LHFYKTEVLFQKRKIRVSRQVKSAMIGQSKVPWLDSQKCHDWTV